MRLPCAKSPLRVLLEDFIKELETNAKKGNIAPSIYAQQFKVYWEMWYEKGWLIEKPTSKDVARLMHEFGYICNRGNWIKR